MGRASFPKYLEYLRKGMQRIQQGDKHLHAVGKSGCIKQIIRDGTSLGDGFGGELLTNDIKAAD